MPIRAVFFDVAHTLLHKPNVLPTIQNVLHRNGIDVPIDEVELRHKLLMDAIVFPDQPTSEFYELFNAMLVRAIGAVPSKRLLEELYSSSRGQPWAAYDDVECLRSIKLPMGILSNWDLTLDETLRATIPLDFEWVICSSVERVRKPSVEFYRRALDATGFSACDLAYVGDSMRLDIEPATALGIRTVLLDRNGAYPYSPLVRISNFSELAGII